VATPKDKRTPGQLRAAELKAEAARADRRRRVIAIVAGTAVAILVVGFFVALSLNNKKSPAAAVATAPFAAPASADVPTLVAAAGLTMLPNEGGTKLHLHSHLQVLNGGKNVVVPADIGIQVNVGLSPLHTHDATGIIHVESPTQMDFTLGQFFKEWNVALSPTCLGTNCADATHDLKVFVDGKAFTGDPTSIKLADHEDITVAYGDKTATVTPAHFDFAAAGL
jgi:hypothetical protein